MAGKLTTTFRMAGPAVLFNHGAYEIPPADRVALRRRMLKAGYRPLLIGRINALYRDRDNTGPCTCEYADVLDGLYLNCYRAPDLASSPHVLCHRKYKDT